ncbi:ABC transporter substrate-binding protein [Falsiroseomonas selenitidurans]|uniref:Thiamine pyrimidine synthase n=1 Tax=Falsiroseomonas selenitidurans TaxID=2716335 RepID=A0ABX1EBE9_9PROT|nr:ABC transporter substrate-binding protein [Falsiroseomonas selenitidurans]NKC34146.1 ABC transporter substrate-binding protein [Falsiroseomonas selenitidurans]
MTLARRTLLGATAGLLAAPALAQAPERIRFVLNFRPDGGTAGYLLALSRGHYRDAGLEVTIDGSSGSGDAITRVASGNYQMGSGDIATLIEFYARNPTAAPKAVMPLHDSSPQAIMSLARSAIGKPADLAGKTIGQGPSDGASRMFPAFCRINGIAMDRMRLQQVTPALRDQMLLTRQVDAVTGFDYTVFFNLKANGVKPEDIRSLRYADHGMDFPGNAMLASRSFIAEKPDAIRRFLAASTRCWHEVMANPTQAARELKQLFPLLEESIEAERIAFLRDGLMITPRTKADGLGTLAESRLTETIALVKDGFGLATTPPNHEIFDGRFLPSTAERRLRV